METLQIENKTVSLNLDKLAEGLLQMHEEDENTKAVLAFGMLDAKIMQSFETNLKERIYSEFTPEAQELFKNRIDEYLSRCRKEIIKGIYRRAKMVV